MLNDTIAQIVTSELKLPPIKNIAIEINTHSRISLKNTFLLFLKKITSKNNKSNVKTTEKKRFTERYSDKEVEVQKKSL